MYHTGPGVRKSGPKEHFKFKGKVLDALLKEFDEHPSDPSRVIAERASKKTGVKLSARRIREVRNERGKTRLSRQTKREASAPTSPHTYS